jgi:ADP-ribose pyrophosphatase
METRNSDLLFQGLVVDIEQFDVRIGDKGWHTYQIVRHPGGAAVLPLHDDGTVTLIRQLRPALDAFMIEAPAGRLDPGEEPAACGLRELGEEAGLSAERVEPLGVLHTSPGVFDEVIHLFLATGLKSTIALPEEYEDISTMRVPLDEAVRMARDGRISDGKTIALLLRADGRILNP